jgi:hypothetical protein
MPDPIQTPPEELVTFEFQHTDRQGNPIIDPRTGKQGFTNFTGKSEREILEKLKTSYLEVTNAHARALAHKAVPKAPEQKPKELSAEEERQAAADLQDPSKARAAVRKLTGVDDIEARQKAADEAKDKADANSAAYQFMSRHIEDYYRCQANSGVISKYITDNDLDPREVENYEIAFNATQKDLAPRPAPPPPPPPEPKIEEEPPPPPKRASGGLQPGELSGERPKPRKSNAITKESVNEMRRTAEGRAEYKKRMRDPEFVRQVNAAFQN